MCLEYQVAWMEDLRRERPPRYASSPRGQSPCHGHVRFVSVCMLTSRRTCRMIGCKSWTLTALLDPTTAAPLESYAQLLTVTPRYESNLI